MIRVITGKAKGIKLNVPEEGTRPLTDRIKTSIFDLIHEFIPNSNVLDLYAGSGAFGIEALSRGAKFAVFIDQSQESVDLIQDNLLRTKLNDQAEVIRDKVNDYIIRTNEAFDIIFLDPPFPSRKQEDFEALVKILNDDGIIILRKPESIKRLEIPTTLEVVYEKEYGRSVVKFLRKTNITSK